MDPVVRRLEPEEASQFRQSVMVPFLEPFAGDPEQVADFEMAAATSELDRAWVVDAGDRFAGNGAIFSLNVTVPAAPGQPCPTLPDGRHQRGRGSPHPPPTGPVAPTDGDHARRRSATG